MNAGEVYDGRQLEMRYAADGEWHPCYPSYKYRLRPEPKPAPVTTAPTCPVCGAVGMFPPGSTGEWYCDQCHKPWDESRRKPCQECETWRRSYRAVHQARADAERRADAADERATRADRTAADAGWRLQESENARVGMARQLSMAVEKLTAAEKRVKELERERDNAQAWLEKTIAERDALQVRIDRALENWNAGKPRQAEAILRGDGEKA